jgi:hypothetical protein
MVYLGLDGPQGCVLGFLPRDAESPEPPEAAIMVGGRLLARSQFRQGYAFGPALADMGAHERLTILPRQRNPWVTDTVEWCRELGPRTRCRIVRASALFPSQLPFEPV